MQFTLAESGFTNGYLLAAKAYSNLPHGHAQDAQEGYVEIQALRDNVRGFRREVAEKVDWAAWSTALSSVLVDMEGIPRWFIPVIDLEIDATDNTREDLARVDYQLASVLSSGTFLRSGDVGSGSYFFVGDQVKPYDLFRKFYGLVMVTLLDFRDFSQKSKENWKKSLHFGEALLSVTNSDEELVVAGRILDAFPSIRSGNRRSGLKFDPRWIAHSLKRGRAYLRYTPGKGYEDKPLVVADFF